MIALRQVLQKVQNSCSRGASTITTVVFGAIAIVILYSAYHILPFYYYYFEVVNQMESVIRVASTNTDQEIRRKLDYHIKKMGIPAAPDDLRITRQANYMTIRLPYTETFVVRFGDKKYTIYTFDFIAEAEGAF